MDDVLDHAGDRDPDTSDSLCFICAQPGDMIVCDVKGCDKVRGVRGLRIKARLVALPRPFRGRLALHPRVLSRLLWTLMRVTRWYSWS